MRAGGPGGGCRNFVRPRVFGDRLLVRAQPRRDALPPQRAEGRVRMDRVDIDKPWLPADCRRLVAEVEARLGSKTADAIEREVMRLVDAHERHMDRESIGLNAGTNVMNPRAAALLTRSLGNRPSLGYPGDKYEMGMEFAGEIEVVTEALVRRLFGAPYAEIRVGSGALANLYAFMA